MSRIKLIKKEILNAGAFPTPSTITYFWNFGILLSVFLVIQILTGIFLSIHYRNNILLSFRRVIHTIRDVNDGWIYRLLHRNGASFFFIFIYCHLFRGAYYKSWKFFFVWNLGIIILILFMASAFMGYVLPWGQISFWGATVITNLLSAIPYLGDLLVKWIWGGFSVNNATLNRFFSLHFIIPLISVLFVALHIVFLHERGSSNPLGSNLNTDKIPFHYYFTIKDLLVVFLILFIYLIVNYNYPYLIGDPENFIEANPIVTPVHIQPEWYLLFAYAILRSIPRKLGGVVALLISLASFMLLPFFIKKKISSSYRLSRQLLFWRFITICTLLTWLGACRIEYPYISLRQAIRITYFMYFVIGFLLNKLRKLLGSYPKYK